MTGYEKQLTKSGLSSFRHFSELFPWEATRLQKGEAREPLWEQRPHSAHPFYVILIAL